MSEKPNVLVICASIRSSGKKGSEIISLVSKEESAAKVLEAYRALDKRALSKYCNSEIMSGIAMAAAKSAGADVDYFSLRRLFKVDDALRIPKDKSVGLDDEMFYIDTTSIKKDVLSNLIKKVERADSIILASPVYFGDRSSIADHFLKLLHDRDLIKGKAFSTISIGAKRNGGQETANVYALYDAISMGGLGLGNGPKTSQYGGTCVGGDRGDILDDDYGIETTIGTGRRSAQVANILRLSRGLSDVKAPLAKIGVIIMADNANKDIQKNTEDALSRLESSSVKFEIVNLIDHKVEKCLGCNICPYPPMVNIGSKGKTSLGKTDYSCIIDNGRDSVEVVRESLKEMKGLIVVGVSDDKVDNLVDQYQSFTERTRFIRRNNFEWMNTVFTSLVFKEVGSSRDNLFGLRSTTSYLRHNTMATSPSTILALNGAEISFPMDSLNEFLKTVSSLSRARELTDPVDISYVAGGTGGYTDTRLDHTTSRRK